MAAIDFKRKYPLTDAEADVALRLLNGGSVSEIAEARGVSLLTVRAQIRALLAKCDARNLRELVLLLAS